MNVSNFCPIKTNSTKRHILYEARHRAKCPLYNRNSTERSKQPTPDKTIIIPPATPDPQKHPSPAGAPFYNAQKSSTTLPADPDISLRSTPPDSLIVW